MEIVILLPRVMYVSSSADTKGALTFVSNTSDIMDSSMRIRVRAPLLKMLHPSC